MTDLNLNQVFRFTPDDNDIRCGFLSQVYTRAELAEELNVNPNLLTDEKAQMVCNTFSYNLENPERDKFSFNDSEWDMRMDLIEEITGCC